MGAGLQDHVKCQDDFEEQPERDVSGQSVLQQQGSPKSQVLKTMDFFFAPSSLTASAGGQGDVVFHKGTRELWRYS